MFLCVDARVTDAENVDDVSADVADAVSRVHVSDIYPARSFLKKNPA
jgi:hypothetical protein